MPISSYDAGSLEGCPFAQKIERHYDDPLCPVCDKPCSLGARVQDDREIYYHSECLARARKRMDPMMPTDDFKSGDRVVYRDRFDKKPQEGTVTSTNSKYVFVCYGLPGSTSQSTDPRDLEHMCFRETD